MVRKKLAAAVDKLALWSSTSREIDGLWVGTMESKQQPGLRRVEDALQLIKRYSPLHHSRVIHNLERVWVNIVPGAGACYKRSLKACVFDERFVVSEATTLERIATTLIHEATHARLEHWGISYDEKLRPRIEAVCLRREIAFATKLPDSTQLQEELARTLEWCATNPDYYFNSSFHERDTQGRIEALHFLGTPDWLIQAVMKLRSMILSIQQLVLREDARH